jgi:hypothetical protein
MRAETCPRRENSPILYTGRLLADDPGQVVGLATQAEEDVHAGRLYAQRGARQFVFGITAGARQMNSRARRCALIRHGKASILD